MYIKNASSYKHALLNYGHEKLKLDALWILNHKHTYPQLLIGCLPKLMKFLNGKLNLFEDFVVRGIQTDYELLIDRYRAGVDLNGHDLTLLIAQWCKADSDNKVSRQQHSHIPCRAIRSILCGCSISAVDTPVVLAI